MVVILLQHKDLVKPAFVQDGVEPLALAALLRTLFPSLREGGDIVGIRHSRQSHFNNLALVCATLSNFTDRVYHIVTADDRVLTDAAFADEAGAAELPLAVVDIGGTSASIAIYREDVAVLQRFNAATQLPSVSLAVLWEVFRSHGNSSGSRGNVISKQDYFECVVELLKAENTGSPRMSDKMLLSRAFDEIFQAFDRHHAGASPCPGVYTASCAGQANLRFDIFLQRIVWRHTDTHTHTRIPAVVRRFVYVCVYGLWTCCVCVCVCVCVRARARVCVLSLIHI